MSNIFSFWEKVEGFNVKVLNEREIRAWAGILFLFAMPIFIISCMLRDFYLLKIFIIYFIFDFFIRIFINPKYSPSLILWRVFISSQKPEYVWAPQKRIAWAIWFLMAITMFFLLIVFKVFWVLNIILCFFCIIFLFFESAFWICIWCKLYNLFSKDKAELCSWGVCENNKKEKIQEISFFQIFMIFIWFIIIYFITKLHFLTSNNILTIEEWSNTSNYSTWILDNSWTINYKNNFFNMWNKNICPIEDCIKWTLK